MSVERRGPVLALQVAGGVLTAAGSLFAFVVLTIAMPFALSTCESETSTPELAAWALAVALAAAAVPALVGLLLRSLRAATSTWFGIAIGWTVAGALAAVVVSQSPRCT